MDAANVHNYKRQITSFEISSCNQRSKVSPYACLHVLRSFIHASTYYTEKVSFLLECFFFLLVRSFWLAINTIQPKYYLNIEPFSNFLKELAVFSI